MWGGGGGLCDTRSLPRLPAKKRKKCIPREAVAEAKCKGPGRKRHGDAQSHEEVILDSSFRFNIALSGTHCNRKCPQQHDNGFLPYFGVDPGKNVYAL